MHCHTTSRSVLAASIRRAAITATALSPLLVAPLLPGLAVTAEANQSVIEEVLVTAQKREQNLQDVSVAVSAFSGAAIEKMGFEEGLDITQQVPNMNFFAIFGEASSPSVSLRGISLVNFSDSWESPVSIYVDDVYRGNPAGSAIQLFDLQRVEVLRGPQGTLYGRNTTGGLVHYVSRKPTEELDAAASISYGSYDETVIQGMVSGPLSSGVRGRIAVKSTQNDGWQTNVISGEKLNTTDSFGYRALLDIDLGENAGLLLNVHGSEADQQTVGFAHMGYLESINEGAATCSIDLIQAGRCYSASLAAYGETQSAYELLDGRYNPEHVASGVEEGLQTKIDTFGTSATFDWDMGWATFTSVTAYEELDKFLQDDGDALPIVWFDEQYSVDAEQYTQEFRLNGTSDRAKWVAGFYYYKDDRGLITQAPTTENGLWHQEVVALDSESWAAFGQYEWDLTQSLTLIAGARYTEETRDFEQDSGPSFYPELDVSDDFSDEALTGRIGLDWRPTAESLAYVSLSTGFKSGGFSGSYNPNLAATQPVDSEDVTNLEVGYKTSFANGRIKLNTAAFTYEVEGYQAQVFLTVEEGSVITNAGDVRGTGAELEVTAMLTDNFEIIGGLGLLQTEFDSEQVFIVAGDEYSFDGNELPSAPELTYNLVARYYVPLGEAGELALQGDYAWQDDHFLQIENDPYSHHDAYGIANAKISWLSASERFTVEAFVKNAFDEEYFTYQNTLGSDWGYAVWGMPRTSGVKFSWKL